VPLEIAWRVKFGTRASCCRHLVWGIWKFIVYKIN